MVHRTWVFLLALCASFLILSCEAEIWAPGPPPEARIEVESAAPGPDYVWIGGYWWWEGNNWAWRSGRWEARPYPGAVWEQHRWEPRGNRYYYHRGNWRRNDER